MGSYVAKVLSLVGQVVDAAIPVANGSRTAVAALVGLATTVAPTVLPMIPPPYGMAIAAAIPVIQQLITILMPLFAIAHITRPAAAPTS